MALKEERRQEEIEDYLYFFKRLSPDILPKSYWENILSQTSYPENKKFTHEEIEGLKRVIAKIRAIERDILSQGYRRFKPILVMYSHDQKILLDGGHHRLQAVRNLIQKKKLPIQYKIPCLVFIKKSDFSYMKLKYKGLFDYSYRVDDIIAGREYSKNTETFKGLINVRFRFMDKQCEFARSSMFLYIKRINDAIYIEFPISSLKEFNHVYIILSFLKKKSKRNIIVKETPDKKFNQFLKKMKDKKLIDEIKVR